MTIGAGHLTSPLFHSPHLSPFCPQSSCLSMLFLLFGWWGGPGSSRWMRPEGGAPPDVADPKQTPEIMPSTPLPHRRAVREVRGDCGVVGESRGVIRHLLLEQSVSSPLPCQTMVWSAQRRRPERVSRKSSHA